MRNLNDIAAHRYDGRRALACLAVAVAVLSSFFPRAVGAQAPAGDAEQTKVGQLLRVSAPLNDRLLNRLEAAVTIGLQEAKQKNAWPIFIFEIEPGRADFGQAYELASFLSDIGGATTVAYVPQSLDGHRVLVALACDEIIMAPDADLGDAGKYDDVIQPAVRTAYAEIAAKRKTVPVDLALAMLDSALELDQVETDVSRELVLSTRLDELRERKSFQKSSVVVPAGTPGVFSGARGRELGFVSYLAKDRADVAKIWQLPREAVEDNPSLGDQWRPVRVYLRGPINDQLARQTQALIQEQITSDDANLIIVTIDSAGGFPSDSLSLANFLASLPANERRTVAYIPKKARADAAYVALGCDQIVMHPDAVLGGDGDANPGDDDVLAVVPLAELARQKNRPSALVRAFADPRPEVARYLNKTDGRAEFFTAEQLAAQPDAADWQPTLVVKRAGEPLMLDGTRAHELGLVSYVVDDFGEFKQRYDLDSDPKLLEPNWAMTLIEALRGTGARWFLLFVGAAALYFELHTPGLGLGGIVGALCFLLYFWSAYLGGTAGWLEVMLFITGILFLMLEVFVLPGFGVFGLSGGLLLIVSVVLASQTFVIPHNEYQFAELRASLTWLVAMGVGTIVFAVVLNHFLPRAPMLRRMLLAPPEGEELHELGRRESLAQFEHLLGSEGEAVTPLYPAGKARFGDELIDCIADGEFIERGQRLEVVQVRGNRVLVRPLV